MMVLRFVNFRKCPQLLTRGVCVVLCGLLVVATVSCDSSADPQTPFAPVVDGGGTWSDQRVVEVTASSRGFVWYKNSTELLPRSRGSGHLESFLRTRYNTIAAQSLDATGRVKPGATFANGSIIVMELFEANRITISSYVLMAKQENDANADSTGWVWGFVTGSGAIRQSVRSKGAMCIGCHSTPGNIDKTLMAREHP